MLLKLTVILLKKVKYGEKNLILQTFTREKGAQALFLNSTFTKGKNKTSLSPLGIYEIVVKQGRGDLLNVCEIRLKEKHYSLSSNVYKSSVILFLNEILMKTIKEYDVDNEMFDFIEGSLRIYNDLPGNQANFHLHFLLKFTALLGFYPNGKFEKELPYFDLYEARFVSEQPISKLYIDLKLSPLFGALLNCSAEECDNIILSNEERRMLLSHIIDYYKIHVDAFRNVQSLEILETVFA